MKTVELSINNFEPVRVDVMQYSVGETIDFVFKDYNGTHANPQIHLRSPSGLFLDIPCTELNSPAGAEFEPNADTFLEVGRYSGSIEFGDNNDPDFILYSFPIWFQCIRNPAIRQWSYTHPAKGLHSANSYDVYTGDLTPIGNKIIAKIGNGAYTLDDSVRVKIPDAETGPIELIYRLSQNKITVINRGDYLIQIPEVTFTGYQDIDNGDNPMTTEIVAMVSYPIESEMVDGVALLSLYEKWWSAPLPRDPDGANIAIVGYDWNPSTEEWDATNIYVTVKSDGTPTELGTGSNATATYRPSSRRVEVEGTAGAGSTKLNHQKIKIDGYYYEIA